jgi:hypothetical protein
MTDTTNDSPGCRPEPTVYHLTFPDHPDLPGLEVRLSSMSIGERIEFDRMRLTPATTAEQAWAKDRAMAEALGARLLSWNLLDPKTGEPVPPTAEGVLSQEGRHINPVVVAWLDAITGVRRPLDSTQDPTTTNGTSGSDLMASIPSQPLTPEPTT